VLFISRPIRIDKPSCLKCHGLSESAPPELVKRYGANNGFGWALGDVVGAQIVSIPAQVAKDRAMTAQRALMFWLGGVFAGLWALINGLVYLFYKRNGFASPYLAKPVAP
jgi:acid phosphatase family membrane protein YuiD